MIGSSIARAARLLRERYAARGLPDPSEPIITTAAQARRMYDYVARTGVVRHIDKVLRDHPGEQPVLGTQMILTAMLLGIKLQGRYMRTVHCAVLAGVDAAVAIKWGLLDPDTGRSLLSYNMVWRRANGWRPSSKTERRPPTALTSTFSGWSTAS